MQWRRVLAVSILAAASFAGIARAQPVESVLSPGPLVQGHAKLEADCRNCHIRFERQAQDRLCAACHKDVGRDVAQRTGLHGRMKPQACRTCHTDHRGRDVRIADFDKRTFDHSRTDYALRGKHAAVDCLKCHAAPQKYSAAPADCASCHRKDDAHKGSLGAKCADCHDERGWRETRFDHGTTRFALAGAHASAKCQSCHRARDYKDVATTCVGCHRAEDKHKGRFGEKCESCHGAQKWAQVGFRHDTDTKYPLLGKHRDVRCTNCHTGMLYAEKLATDCVSCHRKDDSHKGSLGAECGRCHAERGWREPQRFDHARTRFALTGAHAKPPCSACHTGHVYKDVPQTCNGCHAKDDKHAGTLGAACADCHTDRDWKARRFDHARTRFPLRDAHAAATVACSACHKDVKSYRDTARECVACHRKDDKHEGQLGADCANCHGERRWSGVRFDHAQARFALAGAHAALECKACHAGPRFRDAPRECGACHAKADVHKRAFGSDCASCHNVRNWRLWRFDHERQARYALAGAHAKVRCAACHTAPAPVGLAAAPLQAACASCHAADDVHDRGFGARCEQCHEPTAWKRVVNQPAMSRPRGGLQ